MSNIKQNHEIEALKEHLAKLEKQNKDLHAIVDVNAPLAKNVRKLITHKLSDIVSMLKGRRNAEAVIESQAASFLHILNNSKELSECTPISCLSTFIKTIGLGAKIGSEYKEIHFIKANNSFKNASGVWVKTPECTHFLGYKFYVNRAWEQHKIRFTVGLLSDDEVTAGFIKYYDPIDGVLELNYQPGKETAIKNKDNTKYCYVVAHLQSGVKKAELFTKEVLEEKSKVRRYKKGDSNYEMVLGDVWNSKDRDTDYGEMLKKAAVIAFSKMLPETGINEIASYDFTISAESSAGMVDVTPTSPASSLTQRFLHPKQQPSIPHEHPIPMQNVQTHADDDELIYVMVQGEGNKGFKTSEEAAERLIQDIKKLHDKGKFDEAYYTLDVNNHIIDRLKASDNKNLLTQLKFSGADNNNDHKDNLL